jgi:hypothetical protein
MQLHCQGSFCCEGFLTLRASTMTLCLGLALRASTMVRPTLPVPPATATLTMLTDVVGEMLIRVV